MPACTAMQRKHAHGAPLPAPLVEVVRHGAVLRGAVLRGAGRVWCGAALCGAVWCGVVRGTWYMVVSGKW